LLQTAETAIEIQQQVVESPASIEPPTVNIVRAGAATSTGLSEDDGVNEPLIASINEESSATSAPSSAGAVVAAAEVPYVPLALTKYHGETDAPFAMTPDSTMDSASSDVQFDTDALTAAGQRSRGASELGVSEVGDGTSPPRVEGSLVDDECVQSTAGRAEHKMWRQLMVGDMDADSASLQDFFGATTANAERACGHDAMPHAVRPPTALGAGLLPGSVTEDKVDIFAGREEVGATHQPLMQSAYPTGVEVAGTPDRPAQWGQNDSCRMPDWGLRTVVLGGATGTASDDHAAHGNPYPMALGEVAGRGIRAANSAAPIAAAAGSAQLPSFSAWERRDAVGRASRGRHPVADSLLGDASFVEHPSGSRDLTRSVAEDWVVIDSSDDEAPQPQYRERDRQNTAGARVSAGTMGAGATVWNERLDQAKAAAATAAATAARSLRRALDGGGALPSLPAVSKWFA